MAHSQPAAPRSGRTWSTDPGQAANGQRYSLGEALGRSRGGFSTKIHLRTNAKGYPLTFHVTGGEAHEVKGYDALMELHDINPDSLLGDKGYDSDDIRDDLAERGIEPLAEWLRRKIDRNDPTRVCRPYSRLGRDALAPNPKFLCQI